MKAISKKALWVGIMVVLTLNQVRAVDEETTFYAFPLTDQMVQALQEVQKDKQMRLDEVLIGYGFSVSQNHLVLKRAQTGQWRIETFWGHTNAQLFMYWLSETQRSPERPSKDRSKDEIVKTLVENIESQWFQIRLQENRAYEKKLKLFNSYWLDPEYSFAPKEQKESRKQEKAE